MNEHTAIEFIARLDELQARNDQRAAQLIELWSKVCEDGREIKTAREILSREIKENETK